MTKANYIDKTGAEFPANGIPHSKNPYRIIAASGKCLGVIELTAWHLLYPPTRTAAIPNAFRIKRRDADATVTR